MSVMLYKYPGKNKLHGDMFDYIVVNEDEIKDTIANGWCLTTDEAKKDVPHNIKPFTERVGSEEITREELEMGAKNLGIKFPANIKDETLLKKIKEKLDELD